MTEVIQNKNFDIPDFKSVYHIEEGSLIADSSKMN
jgi:hypothetical protein